MMLSKYNNQTIDGVNNNKSYRDFQPVERRLNTNVSFLIIFCHQICYTNQNSEVKIDKSMPYDKALEYLHNAILALDI